MTSIEETFTEYLKNACYAIHNNNINYRLKYVTLFDSSVFDDIPDNVKSFVLHLPLHVYLSTNLSYLVLGNRNVLLNEIFTDITL